MSTGEPLAGRPFPLGRGLVLRNRLVGTAHASGLVSGGLALPRDAEGERDRRVREALERAAAVPHEMTEIAAKVAAMAARVAGAGNPNLRGDSVSAAILAAASARSAACLVDINVALGGLAGDLPARAARAVAAADAAAQQATAS